MLVVLLLALCLAGCPCRAIQVSLPAGNLTGTTGTTYFKNRTIFKFMGIPYAESPVKENRFMPPKKLTRWDGVLDATSNGPACQQMQVSHHRTLKNVFKNESLLAEADNYSEDCLRLDVHSPQLNGSLPVLFYIHGGSFIEGASHNIKPEFLLEHDIVLVAPQYRLGPLGFLKLDISDKTGNAAMYDLVMALEWVRDNINQFGGDPNDVTISGISAGAAAAALLYVSPLTKDLFSKVMLFSGSAVAPWVIDNEPYRHSQAVANITGCVGATDDESLKCLQGKNAPDIVFAYLQHAMNERQQGRHGMGGTIPIVDDVFLTELPEATLKNEEFKGRPMLMSTTRNEGIFLTDTLKEYYIDVNNLENNIDVWKYDVADILMGFSDIKDSSYTVGAAIIEKYFSSDVMGKLSQMTPGIIDFNGAAYFKGPALKMAELNAMRNGTTYLATFTYDPDGKGVNHAADQKYLFPFDLPSYTDRDFNMVKKMTRMCANFVIHGSPTGSSSDALEGVNWSPYSRENNAYLSIDDSVQLKRAFEQEFAITELERRRRSSSAGVHSPWHIGLLLLVGLYHRL
ncbi:esterase E4 [Anabrus simplex]|uniref:esterase E4 n=1 Tax=Anabrus simplex TaxID=316456 RepID=UPI0035A2B66B